MIISSLAPRHIPVGQNMTWSKHFPSCHLIVDLMAHSFSIPHILDLLLIHPKHLWPDIVGIHVNLILLNVKMHLLIRVYYQLPFFSKQNLLKTLKDNNHQACNDGCTLYHGCLSNLHSPQYIYIRNLWWIFLIFFIIIPLFFFFHFFSSLLLHLLSFFLFNCLISPVCCYSSSFSSLFLLSIS